MEDRELVRRAHPGARPRVPFSIAFGAAMMSMSTRSTRTCAAPRARALVPRREKAIRRERPSPRILRFADARSPSPPRRTTPGLPPPRLHAPRGLERRAFPRVHGRDVVREVRVRRGGCVRFRPGRRGGGRHPRHQHRPRRRARRERRRHLRRGRERRVPLPPHRPGRRRRVRRGTRRATRHEPPHPPPVARRGCRVQRARLRPRRRHGRRPTRPGGRASLPHRGLTRGSHPRETTRSSSTSTATPRAASARSDPRGPAPPTTRRRAIPTTPRDESATSSPTKKAAR